MVRATSPKQKTKSALLAPALTDEEGNATASPSSAASDSCAKSCVPFSTGSSLCFSASFAGLLPADQLVHKAVLADHVAKEWVMKHREAYQKEQQQAAGQGEAPAAGGSGEGFVNPLAQNGTTDGPSEGAEEESPASV